MDGVMDQCFKAKVIHAKNYAATGFLRKALNREQQTYYQWGLLLFKAYISCFKALNDCFTPPLGDK
tara:strand:+ start:162 stop:359 length:198 start_codon:yes stop_codon:yes gene_type:complete